VKRPRGRPPARVSVSCAAKVNLGWSVGPRHDDGYHEVQGVLQTVSLADRLEIWTCEPAEVEGDTFEVDGEPIGLVVDGPESSEALRTADNLVFAAARCAAQRAAPRPTTIRLTKQIPSAAGLGGGSADAAGGLVGLALVWGARLQARELLRAAATIGSDVPAILSGGLVHASGRGERVHNIGHLDGTWFVLGVSGAALDTASVYDRLDALRDQGDPAATGCLPNDLEPAAISLVPTLREDIEAMRSAGAAAAFVSGSGPTIVGVVGSGEAAERIAAEVRERFRRVEVCEAASSGVVVGVGSGP